MFSGLFGCLGDLGTDGVGARKGWGEVNLNYPHFYHLTLHIPT